MNGKVILVDKNDNETGTMLKLAAHSEGLLHRAFSIFICNSEGKMLLQQRSIEKYHSGGLWSNACCSHPQPGETTLMAAERRLNEEMGLNVRLEHIFEFIYQVKFENGLTEYEYDHVFFGVTDKEPVLDNDEAAAWKYMTLPKLSQSVQDQPELYTEWFKIALEKVLEKIESHKYISDSY